MPIDPATLGAFILTAGAIVLSPGPDTVLILRYSLSSGTRVGLATVIGVQIGLLVHTALAIGGISLIIAGTPVLFKAVALAGAVYLAWLGIQAFRKEGALKIGAQGAKPVGERKALVDAVLCNLLNPKVIVLFLALFPNFVDRTRDDVTRQLLFLALVLIIINVLWQGPMVWAADRVRTWLKTPRIARGVNWGTGAVLLLFAVLMVVDHLL